MDRNEIPMDRRTVLEVTSLVALATAPSAADPTGSVREVVATDGRGFGYGGAPLPQRTRTAAAVGSSAERATGTDDDETQGYGEYGYGGVVP